MNSPLYIKIHYDNVNVKFTHETNIKASKVNDILWDYLETQQGKGKDLRMPNKQAVYDITIKLDLTEDTFSVSDNCGNDSLRDGIIMYFTKGNKEGSDGEE